MAWRGVCTSTGNGMGACSDDWVVGLISDEVILPKDLEPGHWVLGWRWDCEETAQIWSNVSSTSCHNAARCRGSIH